MKVPTGFVPPDELGELREGQTGEQFLKELAEEFEKLPCSLYTDRHGTNYLVLEVDGKPYILSLRTD